MPRAVQILVALPGVAMGLQAIGWLVDPRTAAARLGMPLLEDGVARSTQMGDLTAFFAATSLLALLGALRREPAWLLAASFLLGGAALFRTLAWLLHGAAFAAGFVGIELVMAAVLLFGAARYRGRAAPEGGVAEEGRRTP